MQSLRYAINITLDGCCHHEAAPVSDETHAFWAEMIADAGSLLYGRVTYEMMESAWRPSAPGTWPEWMADWMVPFASVIDRTPKFVVSSQRSAVDWNATLIRGDLADAVRQIKSEPGDGVLVGGVTLPLALSELGLIDEYEFLVHPVVAGHGPRLFDGRSRPLSLELVGRRELSTGAVALRYVPSPPDGSEGS